MPMATLREVLEFMCQPAAKNVWLLLDIKVDNNIEDIIRLTRETLLAVGGAVEFWGRRVVLGCWTLEFISVIIPPLRLQEGPLYMTRFLTD